MKVPAKYNDRVHISVIATVSMMGDHLIDSKTPQFAKDNPKPFTHTWIYGADDSHITVHEPMITPGYLISRPNSCSPIKRPKSWERAGYYPRLYGVRYSPKHNSYTVSLEGMVKRRAG